MATDTDAAGDSDPMEDADAWKALDREEQSDRLDEGLADLRGEAGDGGWRHLDESEQSATIGAIERGDGGPGQSGGELSETERAMQDALEETWTAEVFADLEDVPTVPFECRELSAAEQQRLMEAMQALNNIESQVEDVDTADVDDLDQLDVDLEIDTEHFSEPEEIDDWITSLLGDVTTDPAFDAERFRTGRGLRTNTRKLLFLEITLRYREESDRAMRFRTER